MPSFLLLYRGPAGDAMTVPAEQQSAVMAAWQTYFGKHGSAIKDAGAPTLPGTNVAAGGKAGAAGNVTGYSIVEARDLAGAKAIVASGHPHLTDARNSIDIFEMRPM